MWTFFFINRGLRSTFTAQIIPSSPCKTIFYWGDFNWGTTPLQLALVGKWFQRGLSLPYEGCTPPEHHAPIKTHRLHVVMGVTHRHLVVMVVNVQVSQLLRTHIFWKESLRKAAVMKSLWSPAFFSQSQLKRALYVLYPLEWNGSVFLEYQ